MQLPNTSATRPSVLGALVHARQGVALQLLLLGLALEPIRGLNLAPARWAQMLRFRSRPVSTTQVLRAVGQLQERGLVDQGASRRGLELNLLREDASRQPYTRPAGGEGGKGYFLLPHVAWDSGLLDSLSLPGLAAFLITLHDTHQKPSFRASYEQFAGWYGISERSAERGFRELASRGLLLSHPQKIQDLRSPSGLRTVWWRALQDPYSTSARQRLQALARNRAA